MSVNLNPRENKVLALLASGGADFGYFGFKSICRWTGFNRAEVRLACRSLTRKGLAKFGKGLWTDDGAPAGSGYAVTSEGCIRADEKLVAKFVNRRWDSY